MTRMVAHRYVSLPSIGAVSSRRRTVSKAD
jgi:hypothetical protein